MRFSPTGTLEMTDREWDAYDATPADVRGEMVRAVREVTEAAAAARVSVTPTPYPAVNGTQPSLARVRLSPGATPLGPEGVRQYAAILRRCREMRVRDAAAGLLR